MTGKLEEFAKKNDIRYFLFNFTDLMGVQRSKLVPASAAPGMERSGAGFAGFASYLDLTPAHPDIFAVPDPDSLVQLPWQPDVAWVAGDLYLDDEPLEQAPRWVLQRQVDRAMEAGLRPKTGVEAEYHLINADGTDVSDPADVSAKPCYDQQAVMRRYHVIAEICDYMQQLGWEPYQNDHEDANGQFEMNWAFDDALVTADRHAFFKFMVKSIAEKHGLRATFMPKPFAALTGNGMHVHLSLWDSAGRKNRMEDDNDELGLSSQAYQVIGGLIQHAEAMCALTNPTVNSYKRINAAPTLSGSTWAPNTATWAGNNRTHMVRVPDPGRIEYRQPDGACNPYLVQAAVIAAALDGIENERKPGKRLDINMYADGHKVRAKRLPLYLIDALRALDRNKALRSALGDDFCSAYINLKTAEWNEYSRVLTDWEREHTLDC